VLKRLRFDRSKFDQQFAQQLVGILRSNDITNASARELSKERTLSRHCDLTKIQWNSEARLGFSTMAFGRYFSASLRRIILFFLREYFRCNGIFAAHSRTALPGRERGPPAVGSAHHVYLPQVISRKRMTYRRIDKFFPLGCWFVPLSDMEGT